MIKISGGQLYLNQLNTDPGINANLGQLYLNIDYGWRGLYVNVSGTWKNITRPSVMVSGTWKDIYGVYVNVSGTWEPIFEY